MFAEKTLSIEEVQRQCDLYRERLEQELDADPECKGNYYILTYKSKSFVSSKQFSRDQIIKLCPRSGQIYAKNSDL